MSCCYFFFVNSSISEDEGTTVFTLIITFITAELDLYNKDVIAFFFLFNVELILIFYFII